MSPNATKSQINDWEYLKDLTPDEIEEKARDILGKMTLEQKVNQMSGDQSLLTGLISMGIRYNSKPIPAGKDKDLGISAIKFSDGPRGIVMNESTCFPVSMARGASFDNDLEERIGNAIGIEGRSQGANFFGGVCINLLRHPAWGRAQETYGEDPYHLGVMGSALTKGIQNHMMACAKHYACNSMENMRFKINVKIDERPLREIYLRHFKACVDNGVASIMSAYNKVNGTYCGHNSHLLRDILKKEWKFKGFTISDFTLGVRDGAAAVNGGLDIEMPQKWRMSPKKLLKYVERGDIAVNHIDDAVLRILRQKLRFNRSYDDTIYGKHTVACKEHIELAREAAEKSIVLLKNTGILPLTRKEGLKIGVFGKLAIEENIGDLGSSRVYPSYVITPLQGIEAAASNKCTVSYTSGKNIDESIASAERVDIAIIVAGFTHKDEGEYMLMKGGDRDSLRLKQQDEELINAISGVNDNCIVVVQGGSAIITEEWNDKVQGILMAWYSGMEGGTALGRIIFGDVNPSAKLPCVFPKTQDQLPYFDKSAKEIRYEYYHGYRLMDKNNDHPAFPFGFGLSYSDFHYSGLNIDSQTIDKDGTLEIHVSVKNEGLIAGDEIVQLYIGYKNSKVDRPLKELKGFTRVHLESAEEKEVSLHFDAEKTAYFSETESKWITESGEYTVFIGGSSKEEDLLSTSFKIR